MVEYQDKIQLGGLQLGMYFSHAGGVYRIDDETKTQSFYMVMPIGRMQHQDGKPQFLKFGRRHHVVLPKSLIVKMISVSQINHTSF